MPTPTASRVAVIGAGTVGATIAFSLIGMLRLCERAWWMAELKRMRG
jgi:malate/lactate dehydrogenase